MIETKSLTKHYGDLAALVDLDLVIEAGDIFGFIGPNGSGKTTTLRMLLNLILPDGGDIRVFGEKPHGSTTDRIGYLPEERGLYKNMKVKDLLYFYGSLKNFS